MFFLRFFAFFPPGNRVHFLPSWFSVPRYGDINGIHVVFSRPISMAPKSGELVSVVAVEDVEDVLKDELEVPESPPNCGLPPKSITLISRLFPRCLMSEKIWSAFKRKQSQMNCYVSANVVLQRSAVKHHPWEWKKKTRRRMATSSCPQEGETQLRG